MAQMMKSPQMKEMMRAQQKVSIDGMYGSLSKYLNLSTNDMDALKELLLQRQMAIDGRGDVHDERLRDGSETGSCERSGG